MAQTVSSRPLTAEARVLYRVSPCGICGGQSGTGTGFSRVTSGFPCQFHSTGVPLQGKTKKIIIFIKGLHNKPQGPVPIVQAVGWASRPVWMDAKNVAHTEVYFYKIFLLFIYHIDLQHWYTNHNCTNRLDRRVSDHQATFLLLSPHVPSSCLKHTWTLHAAPSNPCDLRSLGKYVKIIPINLGSLTPPIHLPSGTPKKVYVILQREGNHMTQYPYDGVVSWWRPDVHCREKKPRKGHVLRVHSEHDRNPETRPMPNVPCTNARRHPMQDGVCLVAH